MLDCSKSEELLWLLSLFTFRIHRYRFVQNAETAKNRLDKRTIPSLESGFDLIPERGH